VQFTCFFYKCFGGFISIYSRGNRVDHNIGTDTKYIFSFTNNNKCDTWWLFKGELNDGRCRFHHPEMFIKWCTDIIKTFSFMESDEITRKYLRENVLHLAHNTLPWEKTDHARNLLCIIIGYSHWINIDRLRVSVLCLLSWLAWHNLFSCFRTSVMGALWALMLPCFFSALWDFFREQKLKCLDCWTGELIETHP